MSTAINPTLTNVGRTAIFPANNQGLAAVNLTHIQIGSGNRAPNGSELALIAPQMAVAIAAGNLIGNNQIRLSAVFGGANTFNITEIGIWAGAPAAQGSKLIFYWSQAAGVLANKPANVDFVFALDLVVDQALQAGLTITQDTNQSLTLALIAAHEAKSDPHPQYTTTARAQALVNTLRDQLLNGAGAAFDTFRELQDALNNDSNAVVNILSQINNLAARGDFTAGSVIVNSDTILAAANVGKTILLDAQPAAPTAYYNVRLPLEATCQIGQRFTLINRSLVTHKLKPPTEANGGGDSFIYFYQDGTSTRLIGNSNTNADYFDVKPGFKIEIEKIAAKTWLITDITRINQSPIARSDLGDGAFFNWASNSGAGWWKLPSGHILQVGGFVPYSATSSQYVNTYFAFPTSFPNNCLSVLTTLRNDQNFSGVLSTYPRNFSVSGCDIVLTSVGASVVSNSVVGPAISSYVQVLAIGN